MRPYYQTAKYFALTISVAAAMSGIALAQNANDPDQSGPSVNQNYYNSNNSNSMMSQAQQELKDQGFYTGGLDGIYGPKTRMATGALPTVQRFESVGQPGPGDTGAWA
jgi:peptidoglycan hydrolase-like protein with peptidoglycan-binding domain